MYTYSANPSTIEEVQKAIENWFRARYKEAKPRRALSVKSSETGLNVFISRSANHDLKIEVMERFLLFEVKHTRLSLNLHNFLVRSAFKGEKLCLNIERDATEHRLLGSVLREFNN